MIWPAPRPQTPASASESATAATNAPNADTGATETLIAPCGCDDHSLDRLRDMVRAEIRALADECADSACIHLNTLYGRLRALLEEGPKS